MNSPSTETYTLPANLAEIDRLKLQQRMWRLILQGLYPAALEEYMCGILNSDSAPPAILDLGCGGGAWAMDMALAFPHAQVTGFDLFPNPVIAPPHNCRFVQGNALECNLDDLHLRGQFDFVHCRSVLWHQKDPNQMVAVIASCLKLGGLALIIDGSESNRIYDRDRNLLSPDENMQVQPSDSTYSRYANWIKTYSRVARGHSLSYDYVELLRQSGKFSGINFQEIFCPMNWEGKKYHQWSGDW